MERRAFLQGGLAALGVGASTAAQAQAPTVFQQLFICRRPVKVRRNIYELYQEDPDHPMIAAYRKGVEVMKSKPDSDPTSWAYQANIHGTNLAPGLWPAGAPFETCEHGTDFFLSWHRMYLYYFERILRKSSGNPDFALPYWDWTTNRRLPPPFRNPTIGPDTNPLYDGSRVAGINNGDAMPASAVVTAPDLAQNNYFNFQGGLEGTPHGSVHGTIGGNMGNFAGAGRDPIFWLHHCNIDRLWEVWLYTGSGHTNPTGDAGWMNQSFTFATETGALVNHHGSEIVDTQTQLRYVYEHTCAPIFSVLAVAAVAAIRRQFLSSLLIAKEVKVPTEAARVTVRQEERGGLEKLVSLLVEPDEAVRSLLVFEGVRTEAPADGYLEVYIGLPEDAEPSAESPYYAGNLDFFGADAESRRSMAARGQEHDGHGLTREIDVTETLRKLFGGRQIREDELSVVLVPAGMAPEGREFRLSPKAEPMIDSITLSIVKEEG
jgi:tyrosinase